LFSYISKTNVKETNNKFFVSSVEHSQDGMLPYKTKFIISTRKSENIQRS